MTLSVAVYANGALPNGLVVTWLTGWSAGDLIISRHDAITRSRG